jgi:XTP/dITP diphosphohydrolase
VALSRFVLATTNPGKIREIRHILDGVPVEIVGLDQLPPLEPPEETGQTFAENARLKALYYSHATGLPAIADDSGLEIDALGGQPGVGSARFGGDGTTYPHKFALLYGMLDDAGSRGSPARFVCAVALAADEAIVWEGSGTVEGRIADSPVGSGGFGYDPIFFYPPYGATLAEVDDAAKIAVAHRGVAFRALRAFLEAGHR